MAFFRKRKKEETKPPLPSTDVPGKPAYTLPQKPKEEEAAPQIETETDIVKKILKWAFQAKATMVLILLTIATSIFAWTLPTGTFEALKQGGFDILAGNWLTLFSNFFIHEDFGHLIGNMLFLFIFGRIVERKFGSLTLVGVYILAGLLSSLIWAAGAIAVGYTGRGLGASGAVSGIIAAAILIKPFQFTYLAMFGIPLPLFVIGWFGIAMDVIISMLGFKVGVAPGVFAHVGGYVAMIFVISVFFKNRLKELKKGIIVNVLMLFAFMAFLYFTGFF